MYFIKKFIFEKRSYEIYTLTHSHTQTISKKFRVSFFVLIIHFIFSSCSEEKITNIEDNSFKEIGRQLYQQKTTFKKFLWTKTGLNKPSVNELKDFAFDLIESKAVFIDMALLTSNQGITDVQELAYLKIIKADKTKPVYLSKAENTDPYYGN